MIEARGEQAELQSDLWGVDHPRKRCESEWEDSSRLKVRCAKIIDHRGLHIAFFASGAGIEWPDGLQWSRTGPEVGLSEKSSEREEELDRRKSDPATVPHVQPVEDDDRLAKPDQCESMFKHWRCTEPKDHTWPHLRMVGSAMFIRWTGGDNGVAAVEVPPSDSRFHGAGKPVEDDDPLRCAATLGDQRCLFHPGHEGDHADALGSWSNQVDEQPAEPDFPPPIDWEHVKKTTCLSTYGDRICVLPRGHEGICGDMPGDFMWESGATSGLPASGTPFVRCDSVSGPAPESSTGFICELAEGHDSDHRYCGFAWPDSASRRNGGAAPEPAVESDDGSDDHPRCRDQADGHICMMPAGHIGTHWDPLLSWPNYCEDPCGDLRCGLVKGHNSLHQHANGTAWGG